MYYGLVQVSWISLQKQMLTNTNPTNLGEIYAPLQNVISSIPMDTDLFIMLLRNFLQLRLLLNQIFIENTFVFSRIL